MKKGNYSTDDNWYTIEEVSTPQWGRFNDQYGVFLIEGCDVTEASGFGPRQWRDGGRRVTFVRGTKPPGFRAKTFIGEVAWCDAERYANDWALKAGKREAS